jgi:type 1 fimbriae regulatory protein FimB/type 1 fimbriae regulatory protein FimE
MQTAQRRGRYGHRDAAMILVAYRHGLRVAELCALRWDQVDLKQGLLHVQRLKQGLPSVQKNIQHTVRYTVLKADRFTHFWTD